MLNISVEILYGKFPNTIILFVDNELSSNLRISSLKILTLSSIISSNVSAKEVSFSTRYNLFGFFSKISLVRFPVPGPTSKISFPVIVTVLIILSIILLSIKKF